MSKKILAIDYDGVLHRYSKGYSDGTTYDEPMEGATEALRTLRARGYEVVIHSARPTQQIFDWLVKWMPEHSDLQITNIKPKAIAYIDDRAIRFVHWRDVLNYF